MTGHNFKEAREPDGSHACIHCGITDREAEALGLDDICGGMTAMARVDRFMQKTFEPSMIHSPYERNMRFIEEALELVQSNGMKRHEAHLLVDYVFDRPEGDPEQEIGGVMVTLYALCNAREADPYECFDAEITRAEGMTDEIAFKQMSKAKIVPAHHVESVVRPWVSHCTFKEQAVLLSAIRGCDGVRKEDPGKPLTRWLRSVLLKSALDPQDNNDTPHLQRGQTFMADLNKIDLIKFVGDLDPYPVHWIGHLKHAMHLVEMKHPNHEIVHIAKQIYEAICHALHDPIEDPGDMAARLEDAEGRHVGR